MQKLKLPPSSNNVRLKENSKYRIKSDAKTLNILAFLVLVVCFTSNPLLGQNTTNSICDDEITCATDPTYLFFEKIQMRAYCLTPSGRLLLQRIRDLEYLKKIHKQTDSTLNNRPNSLGSKSNNRQDSQVNKIFKKAYEQKLPTCYENINTFTLITQLTAKIERARKQLGMPLKIIPKYGSLPTSDINAHTYPVDTSNGPTDVRGSIVGFNTQLFMFAYQMPKVTFPTIEVSNAKDSKIAVDFSRETAIRLAKKDSNIVINFNMALLEFLQLVDPSTQPLDSKFDKDLIDFTTAIELFAVAHEYGHLIKNHTLEGTQSIKLNLVSENENTEVNVGVRSWQQELEADKIGIQLLIQALKNDVADSRTSLSRRATQLRQVYSLYAVLFYFKCSEIVEKAKYIMLTGTPPPTLSEQEANILRELTDFSKPTKEIAENSYSKLENHPPSWLRLERAENEITKYLTTATHTNESKNFSQIGLGLVQNVEILWDLSLPRLPMLIDVIKNKRMPEEISYFQSPNLWKETFLYNTALGETISDFRSSNVNDTTIIKKYYNAINKDWLLLSGLQGPWAIEQLKNGNQNNERSVALCVIALTGDKRYLRFLRQLETSSWEENEKLVLLKANQFLDTYGKKTSVELLTDIPADKFDLNDLLSYPILHKDQQRLNFNIPEKVDLKIIEYLRNNKAIGADGSLSGMALYMMISNVPIESSFSFWSDLLLRYGMKESALEYAKAGINKVGTTASLENAIGNALTSMGNLSEALEHFESSLTLGRIDGWPEMNMAKNYSTLGELVKAEEWFRKALSRNKTARSNSEYAEYLNEFSWFLITHYREDKSCAMEALGLSMLSNKIVGYHDPNFLDTLADCLAANGEFKSAVKISQQALQLLPKDSPEIEKYNKRLLEFSNLLKKNVK